MRNIRCLKSRGVIYGKSVIGRARRKRRRGVLLLVVLSMLVLFMLIGTAFLMSSSQQSKNSSNSAKMNSVGNPPTKDLDSALMQVLRDSDNEHSSIRYHSLLRDIYGNDGFQGVVYSPDVNANFSSNINIPAEQVTRFAGALPATQLGPTNGQFIDIYVRALGWNTNLTPATSLNDPLTSEDESATLVQPDNRHIIKLEKNFLNQGQLYTLPLTKGYFNGCLLTITSGPAAGQSTRILEYEYLADIPPSSGSSNSPNYVTSRLFRFRVMAIARADGQPLQINSSDNARAPEIIELGGEVQNKQRLSLPATFIVNGRPFSGTGVGYNPFAILGLPQPQPRLNAVETVLMGSDFKKALYPEVALTPNAAYFFPSDPDRDPSHTDMRGIRIPVSGLPMNPKLTTALTTTSQIAAALSQWRYPTFGGPGDVNESYDAADFQNMALAMQTVTPRAQGRIVVPDDSYDSDQDSSPDVISAVDPRFKTKDFLRLDLEDLPLPSFHRPDLANYWFHRLLFSLTNPPFGLQPDEAVAAILDPYPNGTLRTGLSADVAALVTAIKRKVSLRPLREDNPHFDGGNPLSIVKNLPTKDLTIGTASNVNIAIPYWEAVGPWDVDNDNDGVPDSIWVDVGNPVQVAADGTRYKALVSYLIVDLDSRLNVNAHGFADDILPPKLDSTKKTRFDPTQILNGTPGNLAHVAGGISSSLQLPRGLGYGPADISLRPLFPAPLNSALSPAYYGNRVETIGAFNPVDDYAALLRGRILQDGGAVFGKYGLDANTRGTAATAGTNYAFATPVPPAPLTPLTSPAMFTGERATPGLMAQLKFFDYPWSALQVYPWIFPQTGNFLSAFGTAPDLKARYALGLDYNGQPVYEVRHDVNPNDTKLPFNLLAKSPYELDLNSSQRRDHWGVSNYANSTFAFNSTVDLSFTGGQSGLNDDAPFSPTDLEKVLRAWDADAGTLPSRLWDCVSAFDPLKLGNTQFGDPNRILNIEKTAFGVGNPKTTDPEYLASAQQVAGINRRLVTTDSFDLPVVDGNFAERLAFGADGKPGRAGVDDDGYQKDDDGDKEIDEADEVDNSVAESQMYAPLSFDWQNPVDDYHVIMGTNPPAKATILDYLRYRIVLELRKQQIIAPTLPPTDPAVEARVNATIQQLLSPDLIAGKKMDLNRPFGDGRDNNGDGVVDDPLEAGDPFLDMNGNGKWDSGDPFIDLDGNKTYTPPKDHMWSDLTDNGKISEPIGFDYTNGVRQPIYKGGDIVGVRNLESQGRQLYARQLYCLMLLLVDENYIAPWDEADPQIMTYVDTTSVKNSNLLKATRAAIGLPNPDPDPNEEQKKMKRAQAEASRILLRKLTCRTIAQWAINCVDMRDSDVIMTPFEYDENPWDGWGVWDDNLMVNPSQATFFPLDGDSATNENDGWVIDWSKIPAAGGPKVLDQKLVNPNQLVGPNNPPIITNPLNQTRGVVWGAERPELLITETLAFHDRRTEDNSVSGRHSTISDNKPAAGTEDADADQGLRPHGSLFVEVQNPWSADGQKPTEIYSRIDSASQKNHKNLRTASNGVELGRLSNFAADTNGNLTLGDSINGVKRSPVWRLIVVEEDPASRNIDPVDDVYEDKKSTHSFKFLYKQPLEQPSQHYKTPENSASNPTYRPADPDFDEAFDAGFVPYQSKYPPLGMPKPPKTQPGVNEFSVKYPYIEREFYFTTDRSPLKSLEEYNNNTHEKVMDYDYSDSSFKLRIPDRAVKIKYPNTDTALQPRDGQTQKFIPWELELDPGMGDSPIAPILPGRYGVIGSAGANYSKNDPNNPQAIPPEQVYKTTIGRSGNTTATDVVTSDTTHKNNLINTRRIELHPHMISNANQDVQQLLVASNGGDPSDEVTPNNASGVKTFDATSPYLGRDNELIFNGNTKRSQNVTDSKGNIADGMPDSEYYQPSVAIPVEGMNVSEPAWGYAAREYDVAKYEADRVGGGMSFYKYTVNSKYPEGRYLSGDQPTYYDMPFDGGWPQHDVVSKTPDARDAQRPSKELERTGTTANYRTVHLQRLANPMLPWNPPPGKFFKANSTGKVDMHQPNLPINPYRTVDTASVNLTAFNGVDESAETKERKGDDAGRRAEMMQWRPWADENQYLYGENGKGDTTKGCFKNGRQVWFFRSLERGAWARLNATGANATPPQRVFWAQEPAMTTLKKWNQNALEPGAIFDLIPGRPRTMRASEVPGTYENKNSQNNFGIKGEQAISENRMNMVMEHTLGFGNESFGLLYDRQGAKVPGIPVGSASSSNAPTDSAVGAPASCEFTWDTTADASNNVAEKRTQVDSTNPWFAWNNRPYVSAEELLNVPAASQATMLRMYSTIDPNATGGNQRQPYGLARANPNLDSGAPSMGSKLHVEENKYRWRAGRASFFGQLPAAFSQSSTGNVGTASTEPADVVRDNAGVPLLDSGNVQPYGAPNFYRILDYVQVPSRFVGTDTMLNAETFNDVPNVDDSINIPGKALGSDISRSDDPRLSFQPPFNKVSQERDPGRVNLNTVTGRRMPPTTSVPYAQIWSEVYDGIMHRVRDANNQYAGVLGQPGPAWRDVVLSRRGYAQFDASGVSVDKNGAAPPDVYGYGLNSSFPTVFANPFRSADAGDLVPLTQMMQFGVDASLLRKHPYDRATNPSGARQPWGPSPMNFGDARDAGFGTSENVSVRANNGAIPSDDPASRDILPLFSEKRDTPYSDTDRNPYNMYQPLTRLGNLVTDRSNVYAVWITIGYFEVEPAPNWNDLDSAKKLDVRQRFGATLNDSDAATVAGLALYNRVYPEGYMLGRELGSDTGNVTRPRGFYIIDRSEPVGFKPGEDLNVEKAIRLRRRIE